jgi:hypothetical protein
MNHPKDYAHHLEEAHPTISAFGGAFLLMLAFHFFFSDERHTMWIKHIEKHMKKLSHWAWPSVVTTLQCYFQSSPHLPVITLTKTTLHGGWFWYADILAHTWRDIVGLKNIRASMQNSQPYKAGWTGSIYELYIS